MAAAPNSMLRLFLAVWPTDEVQSEIVRVCEQVRWPPAAARVAPERLHMTLHFIGDVPREQLAGLQSALQVGTVPAQLQLVNWEVWAGGIAVLRPASVPPSLLQLQLDLGQALQAAGLPVETRPWKAHLTVARKARGAVLPAPPAIDWSLSGHYALVQSVPGGGYVEVQRYG